MDDLINVFFPERQKSTFDNVDETFLNFVIEAMKTSEVNDLRELVSTLFPQFSITLSDEQLSTRIEEYRDKLFGCAQESHVTINELLQKATLKTEEIVEEEEEEDVNDEGVDTYIDESTLLMLRDICGLTDNSEDQVFLFIMQRVILGDAEDTARWILDNGLEEGKRLMREYINKKTEQEKKDLESERMARERVLNKFHETAVGEVAKIGKVKKVQMTENKLRFLDGKIVATNGAKYIEVNKKEEWDGGSRGRVKTKGKRGTGWVMT